MTSRNLNIGISRAIIAVLLLVLSACHLHKPQVTSTPLQKTHAQANDTADSDVVETPPSLEFEWDTEFLNVISPPTNIRKAALDSCKTRGYDLSYMISVALSEGKARGLFGCRGPN